VTIDNGELGVDYARYREPDRMLSERVVDALEQENHLYPQVRSQAIHTRAAQARQRTHQRHQPQRHQPAPER
jgi:hypothetical protein